MHDLSEATLDNSQISLNTFPRLASNPSDGHIQRTALPTFENSEESRLSLTALVPGSIFLSPYLLKKYNLPSLFSLLFWGNLR